MARGRRKEVVEKTVKLRASELKEAIKDASRHKADAAAHSGFHGRTVKNFCERASFDRTIFGWLRKLHDLGDDMKRQSMIRQFLMGTDILGFTSQGDLFDKLKQDIADRVEGDDDDDPRPQFLKDAEAERNAPTDPDAIAAAANGAKPLDQSNAMPLDKAAKAFRKASSKAPAPDALSALAGDGAALN